MRCKTTALRIYWQGSLLPGIPKAETVLIIGRLQDLDLSSPFLTECSRCCFAHPPIFGSRGLFQHLLYLSSLFLLATFPKSFSFNNIFVFFFFWVNTFEEQGRQKVGHERDEKAGNPSRPLLWVRLFTGAHGGEHSGSNPSWEQMLRFCITQVCRHLRLSRNHARFPMNVAVHVPVTLRGVFRKPV